MLATMRDTSRDYDTYWLRDGLAYSRTSTLGAITCVLPPEKLAQIPEDDRRILLEETAADPLFCGKVAELMATDPDWAHKVSASAKEAAAIELDPSRRDGPKKAWPLLRARVRDLANAIAQQARSLAAKLTPAERLAVVRQIATGRFRAPAPLRGLGELGQWDIIGSLVGSLATAGANLYGAKVTADAQEDIAKLQASSAMQGAQAQMAIASANAAIAQAQAQVSSPIAALTSSTIAGVPVIVPVLGVIALGLWLAFGRK